MQNNECFSLFEFILDKLSVSNIKARITEDRAFSGVMHATTGFLVTQLILAYILFTGKGAGFITLNNAAVIVAFFLTLIGATLYPDLDNTASTSNSALGLVGAGFKTFFRGTSYMIQKTIRTRKDDSDPNPHRGFYHTILSTFLVGLCVGWLCKIPATIDLPFIDSIQIGKIFSIIFFAIMLLFMLTVALSKKIKKIRRIPVFGRSITFVIAIVLSVGLSALMPSHTNNVWLPLAITMGGIVHIIGDGFTKQGVPAFFPLSYFRKKRFWWYTRFAWLESGGSVEAKISIVVLYVSIALLVINVGKLVILHV